MSLVMLFGETNNPGRIFIYYSIPFERKPLRIELKSGLFLSVPRWYPFQAIAETVFLDVYRLGSARHSAECIVDVGASIGDFIVAVRSAGLAGQIYAFEPDPRFYKLMRQNIETNNITDVTTYNEPVSSERIAKIASSSGGIGYMKVDCEGCEYGILTKSLFTQRDAVTELHMETHDIPEHVSSEIRDALTSSGYDVSQLTIAKCPYLHAIRRY